MSALVFFSSAFFHNLGPNFKVVKGIIKNINDIPNKENDVKNVEGLIPGSAKELSKLAIELGWMDDPNEEKPIISAKELSEKAIELGWMDPPEGEEF